MMKLQDNILKTVIVLIGLIVIALNVQLYIYCKEQRTELSSMKDKQDVESEFNTNKFKYQEELIDHVSKVLEDARRQVRDQKDALDEEKNDLADQKSSLLQEVEKREELENNSKEIQTSLVDIKAEADAIKQDMKGWQKDYVDVLAQLQGGVTNIQVQIKDLHDKIDSDNIPDIDQKLNSLQTEVDRIANPSGNESTNDAPAPEKVMERDHLGSNNQ